MPTDRRGEESEERGDHETRDDGRGIDKLKRWARTVLRILARSALMVVSSTAEFFARRRSYRLLGVCFVYLPLGFVSLLTVLVLGIEAGYFQTEPGGIPLIVYQFLGVPLVAPLLGLSTEYARERFLGSGRAGLRSGWPNRAVMGIEVAVLGLLFTVLAATIAGDVTGGLMSLLPRSVTIPPIGNSGPGITIGVEQLIAAYVFPAGFVLYIHDERLSALWPPSQFSAVVVDERYVSLSLAWVSLTVAISSGLQFALGVIEAAELSLVARSLLRVVVGTWGFALLALLSLFTIASNARAVESLVDQNKLPADAIGQSTLSRYLD